jgi:hypothetical protein
MSETDMSELPPEIDTSRPHSARIYDYFLGGKNHFAADREVAEEYIHADLRLPGEILSSPASARLLRLPSRQLARRAGIV